MKARTDRRGILALAAVAAASVASVASLDEAAPFRRFTGMLPEQSAALAEDAEKVAFRLHASSTDPVTDIELHIQLTARWAGFAAGTPDNPIVEATLAGDGATSPDGAETLYRSVGTAPEGDALIVSATAPCQAAPGGCGADFTFTLDRIEHMRSGLVSIRWTPVASVDADTATPVVRVTVTP